jgi:uncharacterized coiled-coil DUF342 family protein
MSDNSEQSDAERQEGRLGNGELLALIKELRDEMKAARKEITQLHREISGIHGAHNGELTKLNEQGIERYEAHRDRIVKLEDRLVEINPALMNERLDGFAEKLSDLRSAIDENRGMNIQQDTRWENSLMAIIKWGAAILSGALAALLIKKVI